MELFGGWFGTGTERGIALLFTVAGMIGLAVTLLAMRSSAYRALAANYEDQLVADRLAEDVNLLNVALEAEA